jgi:hypothetical protein
MSYSQLRESKNLILASTFYERHVPPSQCKNAKLQQKKDIQSQIVTATHPFSATQSPTEPHPSPTCLHDDGLREPLCFRMMCSTCTSSLPFIFLAGGSSLQPSCKMKPPSHQHGESLGKHAKIDRLLEMYRNAVMFEDVG